MFDVNINVNIRVNVFAAPEDQSPQRTQHL